MTVQIAIENSGMFAPKYIEAHAIQMADEILAILAVYDKAGIASRDRLEDAPRLYHPRNIMPNFQSIIVLAQETREPPKELVAGKFHDILGTVAAEDAVVKLLNDEGYKTQLIGSRTKLVSLPRLGERAGVGQISPFNSLAVKGHGLRTVLSAIITDAPLRPSPLVTDACPNPGVCLKRCAALSEDGTFDRSKCKSCGACVKKCPAE